MKGLVDSTLREGEQTVGVSFTPEQKIEIVRGLFRIGVEEVEVGIAAAPNPDLQNVILACRELRFAGRLAVWCRCKPEDVDLAATIEPDVLSLSVPVSDLHISRKFCRSRDWVLSIMVESIKRVSKHGIGFISVGLEDALRADPVFLDKVVCEAASAGAHRVRLADTVGTASPQDITALVRCIKEKTSMEVGVHMHNDFGMATANSLAALDAGADWADVTILGLGERAGNARLEELGSYLSLKRKRHYKVKEISDLCYRLAKMTGRVISLHHPVIGNDIFTCETGLHLQGLVRDPSTYEPFDPARIGATRRLLFGEKIGRRVIGDCLASLGNKDCSLQLAEVVNNVKYHAKLLGRPLAENEINELLRTMP